MIQGDAGLSLIFRVHARLCALPVAHVVETMRPLPVESIVGAPPAVLGLAVIRGAPVPVLDAARLLGDVEPAQPDDAAPPSSSSRIGRFVALKVGARCVALAVGSVLGVRHTGAASLQPLPPLLDDAGSAVVAAIGRLDAELLWVLQGARVLPDEAWLGITGADA